MNTRYTTVNLDVSQQGSIPSITLSQYDLGVGLGFYIMDGGLPYSAFAETDTVVLSGTKPSGVGFTIPAYYKSENLCSFRTTQAMTTEAGTVTCEITITKVNNISVSTANFFVEVEASAHAHETVDEDIEDFSLIANQVGEYKVAAVRAAQQAAQSATDAAASAGSAEESMEAAQSAASSAIAAKDDIHEYIDDSEAWARGTRGGTAVPSTDETYENNAKYYAEQSSQASMDAGVSASEAATSAQEAAASVVGAVKYTAQSLTTEQKAQARTNIGAASPSDIPSGTVRYDTSQSLTDAQKTQAKNNIGVPAVDATLAVTGAAADAKKVGDEIADIKGDLENFVTDNLYEDQVFTPVDGYNANNAGQSNPLLSPFVLYSGSDSYSGTLIDSIKLNVKTAGKLTIGTIKKIKVDTNLPVNLTDVNVKTTLMISSTGVKDVSIQDAFVIPQDEYLFVNVPSDTCKFAYGQYGVNKGFYNNNNGSWILSTNSLGINVYVHKKNTSTKKSSRFFGNRLSIIGDSIDTFDQSGYKIDGYVMYYPSGNITNVEQTWWKKVLNTSGMTLERNASWSGSRVTNTHPSSYPDFYQRVSASILGSPDTIFVTLGTNDSSNNIALGDYDFNTSYVNLSESTFRTAYIKGIKALQALYPSAQIVCISEKMADSYKSSIAYIAENLGVVFIDASDYVGENGVHPGEKGMSQIASLVLYPTDETLTQYHIPADAKKIGEEITNLKASDYHFESIDTTWEFGSLTPGTGQEDVEPSRRIRSDYIECNDIVIIKNINENYGHLYYLFDSNKNYVKEIAWESLSTITINKSGQFYIRIVLRKNDNTAISSSEINTLANSEYISFGEKIGYVSYTDVQTLTDAQKNIVRNNLGMEQLTDSFHNISTVWTIGTLSPGTGGEYEGSNRLRSGFIECNGPVSIMNNNPPYQHLYYIYDANKQYVLDVGWSSDTLVIDRTGKYYIRVLIRISQSNDNISSSQINAIASTEFIKDGSNGEYPIYFENQLSTGVTKINNNIMNCGIGGDTFIFITDIHWPGNTKTSHKLIKYIIDRTNVSRIFVGGDLINDGYKSDQISMIKEIMDGLKSTGGVVFGGVGNHEYNTYQSYGTNHRLSKSELFGLMQKQSEYEMEYGGLVYFATYNPTANILYIMLDTNECIPTELFSTQQIQWLNDILGRNKDKRVVILGHGLYRGEPWAVGLTGDDLIPNACCAPLLEIVDSYNNDGGHIECIILGHVHIDCNKTTPGGVPIIMTETNSIYTYTPKEGTTNVANSELGTVNELAFDVYTVDYIHRVIKTVRIGRGSDREITY